MAAKKSAAKATKAPKKPKAEPQQPPVDAQAVQEPQGHLQAAAIPEDVKSGLLNLLRTFGPLALHIAVGVLKSTHPAWGDLLDPIEAALGKFVPSLPPAGA